LASARAMAIMAAKKDFLRFQKHILWEVFVPVTHAKNQGGIQRDVFENLSLKVENCEIQIITTVKIVNFQPCFWQRYLKDKFSIRLFSPYGSMDNVCNNDSRMFKPEYLNF
jgi:hypothetical protein